MKRFFLLLTVSMAFAASVLARASEAPANEVIIPIETAQFSEKTMTATLTGRFSNPCLSAPHPALSVSEEDENTLVLDVVAFQPQGFCATMMAGTYELAFDIRSLKNDLIALNLNPEAQYKIITRNGDLAVDVDFKGVLAAYKYSTQKVAGGIFAVEQQDGRYIVAVAPEMAFEVKSPFINMAKYVGQKVTVQGHVVNSRKPGVILDRGVQEVFPAILVTGINTNAF